MPPQPDQVDAAVVDRPSENSGFRNTVRVWWPKIRNSKRLKRTSLAGLTTRASAETRRQRRCCMTHVA